jgi:hypothetical protein
MTRSEAMRDRARSNWVFGVLALCAVVGAILTGASPASAAPTVEGQLLSNSWTCARSGGAGCTPAKIFRGAAVSVPPARTEIRRYTCPPGWYMTWYAVVPEPDSTTIAGLAASDDFDPRLNWAFHVRVHNWVGPSNLTYRLYWKCRESRILDPTPFSGSMETDLTQIVIDRIEDLVGTFTDDDNPSSATWLENLRQMIVGGIGTVAPARAASTPHAGPAGVTPHGTRQIVRLRAGANLLSVVYPHPSRVQRPPAAALRLSGPAAACRANRLIALASHGRAFMGVRLDCPPSAAGTTAVLEARDPVRRTFNLRDGRLPLQLSVPVPRGEVSAYAVIEGPRGTPCRVAPARVQRRPRLVSIRTTARCRGVRPGTRGTAWVGGLIDGAAPQRGRG